MVSTPPPSTVGGVHLTLAAGPLRPNHAFIMLGSLSGTGPGTWLDSTTLLPLNADAYTQLTVSLMAIAHRTQRTLGSHPRQYPYTPKPSHQSKLGANSP
jgi:hypothetical protein